MPQIIRQLFEQEFSARVGARDSIAVNSGTSALVGALLSLDLRGREVITTPFTFVSTANAIILAGGVPVFVDIREDNHLIDERLIERAVTERTKAILPVHLFGRVCEMNAILKIAERYSLTVVEDAAQALGVTYRTRYAGAIGDLGCFSFYKTKNLSTFEGGMIAVNRGDARRIRCLVDPIANREAGFPCFGHNFRMPEPCALIGLERVKLHWNQVLAELGRYSELDGYYPYVVYATGAFRNLGIIAHCPIAEGVAHRCRES